MSNTGWALVGFVFGIMVVVFWSEVQESELVREAVAAQKDGRTINNEMMRIMYPATFRDGNPEYLERDFEAGADFVCDEIRNRFREDMCSSSGIGWR
jgi:hypothetical protein